MASAPTIQTPVRGTPKRPSPLPHVLPTWLRAQTVNVLRHSQALRPFRRQEFGAGAAVPSEAHLQAANNLIRSLRIGLVRQTRAVLRSASEASREPSPAR